MKETTKQVLAPILLVVVMVGLLVGALSFATHRDSVKAYNAEHQFDDEKDTCINRAQEQLKGADLYVINGCTRLNDSVFCEVKVYHGQEFFGTICEVTSAPKYKM